MATIRTTATANYPLCDKRPSQDYDATGERQKPRLLRRGRPEVGLDFRAGRAGAKWTSILAGTQAQRTKSAGTGERQNTRLSGRLSHASAAADAPLSLL